MNISRRSAKTVAIILCVCISVLFTLSASAEIHTTFCTETNCHICAAVSKAANTVQSIFGGASLLKHSSLCFAFGTIIFITTALFVCFRKSSPIIEKTRLDC